MKKLLLCTSWKMNLSVRESIDYAKKLNNFVNESLPENSKIEIFILPDFLPLYAISQEIGRSRLKFGAQDCFWEDKGAFTGEVSPMILRDIGCSYILVGHPERITYLKEDSEMINKKLKACLRNNITPVLLVIEREKKVDIGKTCNMLMEQLFPYLEGIHKRELNKIIMIYEPAWAIGTTSSAPVEHTHQILSILRDALDEKFGKGAGQKQLFMYGGGVTLESAKDIMELDNINGIGMGKAGLNFDFFAGAIKLAIELEKRLN
ncbi:MAG: triose-phosphate isomerase [Actinobacteria bacterium]|nr:triose-phosphate isomerase [Actinomycetota bacterium]